MGSSMRSTKVLVYKCERCGLTIDKPHPAWLIAMQDGKLVVRCPWHITEKLIRELGGYFSKKEQYGVLDGKIYRPRPIRNGRRDMEIKLIMPLNNGYWVYARVNENILNDMFHYSALRGFRISQYVDAVMWAEDSSGTSQHKVELNVQGRSLWMSTRPFGSEELHSASYSVPRDVMTSDETVKWLVTHGVEEKKARQVVSKQSNYWPYELFILLAKALGQEGKYETLHSQ